MFRLVDPVEIDANKPIKTDVESQSVDVPSSTTIALSSNEPDDKNHSQTESQSQSQSHSNDDKKSTGKLNSSMQQRKTNRHFHNKKTHLSFFKWFTHFIRE